jgi:hypothetical protein
VKDFIENSKYITYPNILKVLKLERVGKKRKREQETQRVRLEKKRRNSR